MKIEENVPYSKMGYWRIGGVIEKLVTLQSVGDLEKCVAYASGKALSVIGNGPNLLLSDRLDLEPIITHQLDMPDYQRGFELMQSGEGIKIVLKIPQESD